MSWFDGAAIGNAKEEWDFPYDISWVVHRSPANLFLDRPLETGLQLVFKGLSERRDTRSPTCTVAARRSASDVVRLYPIQPG